MLKIGDFSKLSSPPRICAPLTNPPPDGGGFFMICLTGLTFTGQAGIIGHTILMGGAVMADIFIRALPKYAPDLIVLLGLYLLLLGRWKKQGRRRVLVYTVFSVYMLGVLWVTVLPVLSMLGIHHAYAPMNLEPFRDLRLGYGNAERQLLLNVLMTVPFGILWPVVRRGKAGVFRTVGAAFLLSLCIELIQPLLPTARMSDITDLICNTAGGLIGYGLYRPWKKALGCWM